MAYNAFGNFLDSRGRIVATAHVGQKKIPDRGADYIECDPVDLLVLHSEWDSRTEPVRNSQNHQPCVLTRSYCDRC